MIVEVSALDQAGRAVGIEEADALTTGVALARIDETFRPARPERCRKRLSLVIAVGVERRGQGRGSAAEIVQVGGNVEDELAEL